MIEKRQVRAVSLKGYLQVARLVGLDPYERLRAANIRPSLLEDGESRLPAANLIALLEDSARLSGCESFGVLMAECRTFESLGPIALLLDQLGSVREVMEAAISYRHHLNDIVEFDLEDGDPALIKVGLLAQYATNQAIDLTLALAQIVLYSVSRRRWRPETAHFQHAAPADLSIFRRFFPCRLVFEGSFTGFEVSPAVLDEKWPWARHDMAAHAERLLELVPIPSPESSVAEQVNRSLALLLPAGRATLDDVAENLGTYGRALQRRLEEQGNTYGDLLNRARRELSQRYLSNGSQTISSVAELAGYSSLSSFTRWFASEFGMPPREWRAQNVEPRIGNA